MEKRFRALRVIATIYKIFAWIVLGLGILVALYLLIMMLAVGAAVGGERDLSGLVGGGVAGVFAAFAALLYGVILFLVLYGAGEAIYLALAIEENTRETTLLIRNSQRTG